MVNNERVSPNTRSFWRNFVVDVIVGIGFAWFGVTRYGGTALEAAALVLGTLVAWPLLEYLFHRWLMHGPVPVIRKAHEEHHAHPHMTPPTPWFAHLLVGVPLWAALAALTSGAVGALLTTGLYIGYTWFRFVHRMVHFHAHTVAARFMGRLLKRHAIHHARQNLLYGVTTQFWDRVFGTFTASS